VLETAFRRGRPVFTSAGVTAGIDLALHVIARQLGAPVAAEVARDLVVYLRRAGTDPALSPWLMHRNHLHPAVHRVQDAWRAIRRRLDLGRAVRGGLHQLAQLTRLFAEHAHCSPLDYVQLMASPSRASSSPEPARSGARGGEGGVSLGPAPCGACVALEGRPPSALRGREPYAALVSRSRREPRVPQ